MVYSEHISVQQGTLLQTNKQVWLFWMGVTGTLKACIQSDTTSQAIPFIIYNYQIVFLVRKILVHFKV